MLQSYKPSFDGINLNFFGVLDDEPGFGGSPGPPVLLIWSYEAVSQVLIIDRTY